MHDNALNWPRFWQRIGSGMAAETARKCAEMAAAFTRAVGQEVRYNAVSPDLYRSLVFPVADDLGNMFQFKRDFNDIFCGARNVDLARALPRRCKLSMRGLHKTLAVSRLRSPNDNVPLSWR